MAHYKIIYSILVLIFSCYPITFAQPKIVSSVHYTQISSFETDYSINEMKMSADGSKIVFATGGPQVKVFTINTNGTDLVEIYNLQTKGYAPFIDISSDGEKVLWCDRFGEIFIANSDGTVIEEIATLLPNPDTSRADLEPEIPLPPRFTADGGAIFFLHVDRDPRGSGVWSINTNNTNLTQIFNYLDVTTQVYGRDGTEYNFNTSFSDGFDINGDGSRIIFGIKTFKIEEGDFSRGDAIVAYGSTFYKLCDYALGSQPFATNMDDDVYLVFKREFNADIQNDEINVYFQPFGTGDPIKVMGGIEVAGSPSWTQISANGSAGIIHGNNGRVPIAFVDRVSSSHVDLVSIDGISRGIGGFNFSESALPSINDYGNKFCFLAYSSPPQIWVGDILSDATSSEPHISGVKFTPNYVLNDGISTAEIEAYVSDLYDPINFVTIQSIKDGSIYSRALTADSEGGDIFFPRLFDDGTFGDQSPGDKFYTNNTVRRDLIETPLGDYGIRIAAVNNSLKKITMVDAETFSIVDNATSINLNQTFSESYELSQNYPNPFNPNTTIKYSLPLNVNSEKANMKGVTLRIYDLLGREVATLVNKKQKPGSYQVEYNANNIPGGVYFYSLIVGDFFKTKKMTLLK